MINNFEDFTEELSPDELKLVAPLMNGLRTKTKENTIKAPEIVKAMKKDFKGPEGVLYAIATDKAIDIAEMAKKIKEERFKKGTDIGKKGPGFEKIEKSAEKKYGSEEAGKRVAGAVLQKILAKKGK